MDILIENGHVIDPFRGVDGVAPVALRAGRVAESCAGSFDEVVNAAGAYVLPGLIDHHTHVFAGGTGLAVPADLLFSTGVTTAVDAGSAGCAAFDAFCASVVANSRMRVLALLNAATAGILDYGLMESLAPQTLQWDAMRRLFARHGQTLRGLKLRLCRGIVGLENLRPLEMARDFADEVGCYIAVHASDPIAPMADIARALRPGDCLAHCFHGKGADILDENGRVRAEIKAARARGVLFETADGRTNYCHRVARAAIAEGFFPDIISSDTTLLQFGRAHTSRALPCLMAKYRALGMPRVEVVRAVTETPARRLGQLGEIGTLAPGARADAAIFRPGAGGDFILDNFGEALALPRAPVAVMTVSGGDIVYRAMDF